MRWPFSIFTLPFAVGLQNVVETLSLGDWNIGSNEESGKGQVSEIAKEQDSNDQELNRGAQDFILVITCEYSVNKARIKKMWGHDPKGVLWRGAPLR